MKINDLPELLVLELKDLYSAERQIAEALPKIIKTANNPDLVEGLEKHLIETEGQIERLNQVATTLGIELTGEKCQGMEGLLKEGAEMLKLEGPDDIIDIAITNACRRVEHYEIAGYTSAIALADSLQLDEVVDLLKETLEEEEAADETLTEAAEDLTEEAIDED